MTPLSEGVFRRVGICKKNIFPIYTCTCKHPPNYCYSALILVGSLFSWYPAKVILTFESHVAGVTVELSVTYSDLSSGLRSSQVGLTINALEGRERGEQSMRARPDPSLSDGELRGQLPSGGKTSCTDTEGAANGRAVRHIPAKPQPDRQSQCETPDT